MLQKQLSKIRRSKTIIATAPNSAVAGFTLVELLVVIAIIGILLGIMLPAMSGVMERGRRTACTAEIQQLETALRLYESDHRDFPPSTVGELKPQLTDNKINSGIEALVACLSSNGRGTPYFEFAEDKLENGDADVCRVSLKSLTGSYFQTNALFELNDPWTNPYVYFHSRDLVPETKQVYLFQGSKVEVKPNTKPEKTGNLHGFGRYQIISGGIDGVFNSEDDLISK